MKVVFVCTGNTCRSPMAEGIFNHLAAKNELDIKAESCGTGAFPGDSVSEKSVSALKKYGIDISSHRARAFSPYMAQEDTLFVCMSRSHKAFLERYVSSENLMCFSDVPDPYGMGQDEYDRCAEMIMNETKNLIDRFCMNEIVPMQQEDTEYIAEIEKECFSSPWSLDGIKEELNNESARFFVFRLNGKAAGYIGSHIVLDECYIANVAVMPGFRRRGIGERLVEKAVKTARDEGCSFISLEVRLSNSAAISLYEKLGFEKIGERKNFYSSPTENALIMTRFFSEQ